jgi:hypothetical protein
MAGTLRLWVSIACGYGLDYRAIEVRSGQRQRIFPLASESRPAVGATQPPVQWVPAVLFPGIKLVWGVTLTTHPHLVPRSWMSRSYTFSPPLAFVGVLWDCITFIYIKKIYKFTPELKAEVIVLLSYRYDVVKVRHNYYKCAHCKYFPRLLRTAVFITCC